MLGAREVLSANVADICAPLEFVKLRFEVLVVIEMSWSMIIGWKPS